jgi:very-short-patch-repair endonuclease
MVSVVSRHVRRGELMDEPAIEPAASEDRLEIAVEAMGRLNYALQQNDVPLVRRISLSNPGKSPLDDVLVRAWIPGPPPCLAEPCPQLTLRIARIEPGSTYNIEHVDLPLSPAMLAAQTERVATELIVEALVHDRVIGHAVRPIEVLAFNEWGGVSMLPELIAAFVMPNHPAIDPLLKIAGEILERSTGDSALSGYQPRSPSVSGGSGGSGRGGRGRAAAIAEGVYLALKAMNLGYINPPASFEARGQKIRTADQVLSARLGTCLDLSVLLAAAWEQAGLHPLIVIVHGHAFPAFWTREECFPEPTIEDALRLHKRIELGEIVPVEATALTGGFPAGFADAVKFATDRMHDRDGFIAAVDIRAARRCNIRPLALSAAAAPHGGRAPAETTDSLASEPRPLPTPPPTPAPLFPDAEGQDLPALPRGRIDRWKRKLLDLSLRNRLINFRETRLSIPLLCPDLAALENAIASGGALPILPRPAPRPLHPHPQQNGGMSERHPPAHHAATVRGELEDGRLRADLAEPELARRLTALFRAARTSLEESGANTLYLALGTLTWYEADDDTPRRAPLILLPLQLERQSAREGYRIRQTDEPPRVNITLLEKLRVDFGMDTRRLEDLPEDASGLDMPLILRRFREAVKEIDRWEITESASLGLFSFAKFLMWVDLQERTGDLLKNRMVSYLVERHDAPFDATPFPDARDLDRTLASNHLLCPLDADSSQLVAIHSAAAGQSFLLEGPPGTGKSQTITNLIAHALGQGKRVLFVAEKVAALDVVHRRLERCGLAPFCLELHSSKASKKEVIAQIVSAFAARTMPPRNWEMQCAELDRRRAELNTYVDELHRMRPSGESFYQGAGRLTTLSAAPEVDLPLHDPAQLTREKLEEMRRGVEALITAAGSIDDASGHPLRGIGRGDWREALPEQVRGFAHQCDGSARDLLERCENALGQILPGAGEQADLASEASVSDLGWLVDVVRHMLASPSPPEALLRGEPWGNLKASIEPWIRRGKARDELRRKLFASCKPELLELDLGTIASSLEAGMARPLFLRWLACRAPRRQLAGVVLGGKLPANDRLLADLRCAITVRDESGALAGADEAMRVFGQRWAQGEANWNELEQMLGWVERFRELMAMASSVGAAEGMREACIRLASEARERLVPGGSAALSLGEFLEAHARHIEHRREMEELLEVEAEKAWGEESTPRYLPTVLGTLARWVAALPELRDWCFWRRGRAEAVAAGLEPLVESFERGALRPDDFAAAMERSITQQWVHAISDGSDILRNFSGDAHTAAIEKFRALDTKVIEMTREVLRARLSAGIPEPAAAAATSEMGLLQRQSALKRGHMPVRRLVQKLPNLLPRLKPCFLMSPLSVAQHLDTSFPPFDVVVFDEASQIPVWDAIGAIARGTEVIVVGDSKQLPPTNFFSRIEGEEAQDEDEIEELESILDECNASGIPSLPLLWHYRSRHESLIAFSNYHYYGNSLHTFPSSVDTSDSLGVSMRYLSGGRYDRGGSRTNRAEAEAIVEEIMARLQQEAPPAQASIGIVTFNAAQQTLIEDLLDEKRRQFPAIERFFSEGEEPIFVKNLENVQGDEREAILFSICYGPDETGRITMNFGPLGHQGGERRLNVAITRARRQVIVFSSIRAEHIDMARTRAVGVGHLKSFLEYAERGPRIMGEGTAIEGYAEAPAPLAVAAALRSRGWDVAHRVGCSGYRIDLAVWDPERVGEYLLGIEFDGEFYHSGRTARDRDRLRQQVLQSLGWRLHRVWSADWRLNPERTIERLDEAIRRAQRARNRSTAPSFVPSAEPAAASDPGVAGGQSGAFTAASAAMLAADRYEPHAAESVGDSAEFYSPAATRRIAGTLRQIVEKEAPITLALAARRLAALYGIDRITSRVEVRLAEVLAADTARSRPPPPRLEGDTLWKAGQSSAEYRRFRVHGDSPQSQRDIDDIPLAELANAAAAVLEQQVSLPFEDLIREAARLLGFPRVTPRIRARLAGTKERLLERGAEFDEEGEAGGSGTISAGRKWRRSAIP